MPLLVDTSAVAIFEKGTITSSAPRLTLRLSSQSTTSSARRYIRDFQRKYPRKRHSAATPNELGSGFRHKLPSSMKGAVTHAISAAALSQMPRLNRAVFLKEMTCIIGRIIPAADVRQAVYAHTRPRADAVSSSRRPDLPAWAR